MATLRKKIYIAAGYNTVYFGSGRQDFDPQKPLPTYEMYLQDVAKGTLVQLPHPQFDEGIIGSFMSGRFLKQGNLPGFLPFMIPSLLGKPCTAVEGACGTGGKAIAQGLRSVLADLADVVFVSAFEMQNTMKAIYGADVLAGAGYYRQERKQGHSYFFPGVFSDRAGSYYERYGQHDARKGMAKWYELAILNARKNPKAQEYHNTANDLLALGMTPPDPKAFVPHLNWYDCSKVSDGASSLIVLSDAGLERSGITKEKVIEIVAIGEAQGDITRLPEDPTVFETTEIAVRKALQQANVSLSDVGILEIHDCFTISALLSLEAIGFAKRGQAPRFILDGNTTLEGKVPTNLSGGLGGFGHPTGASGVRQMVDLLYQLTGRADNQANIKRSHGMMISMGGNDKTVTCIIVKKC